MNYSFLFINVMNSQLRKAYRRGHLKKAINLIEHNASNFNESLHLACISGHLDIAKLMIAKGANDLRGALYWANMFGHFHIVRYLLDIKNDHSMLDDILLSACQANDFETVDFVIAKGATVVNFGFHAAYKVGHYKMAMHMIAKGATEINYINRYWLIEVLNMNDNAADKHKDTRKLKEIRALRVSCVTNHFTQLKYSLWDHNIITPLICNYISYDTEMINLLD